MCNETPAPTLIVNCRTGVEGLRKRLDDAGLTHEPLPSTHLHSAGVGISGQTSATAYAEGVSATLAELRPILAGMDCSVMNDSGRLVAGSRGTCFTYWLYDHDGLPRTATENCAVRSVDQIRAEIKSLEQELVVLAGESVMTWHGTTGSLAECPATGAVLDVSWAIEDQSYQMWYPTVEGARAALVTLARTEDGELSSDGWTADLTRRGCHPSRAYITRLGAHHLGDRESSPVLARELS